MTRAYLRLDPNLRRTKRDYPDGAFRAFVEILCAAESQSHRGRFESLALLRALLGPRARWIHYLLDHDDLMLQADGELYVDGWDDWQEGDVTVPERMVRLRARKARRTVPVTDGVTPAVTVDDTVPVTTARIAEAVSGALDNSGGGPPYNGAPTTTFMGYKPRPEAAVAPGERVVPIHDGRHGKGCDVCAPLLEGKAS